jgi:hypothetical protein
MGGPPDTPDVAVPPEVAAAWMRVGRAWVEANGSRTVTASSAFELACLAVWLVLEQRDAQERERRERAG